MRRTTTAMLAGLLLLPALPAADKPASPGVQLEAIKNEFEMSRKEFYQAYEKAKTGKERRELHDKRSKQLDSCARRALELAQKNPKDPVAVEALFWIIGGGLGWGAETETAYDLLRKDYVTSDKLEHVCRVAAVYKYLSTKPERLLRDVLEKNPHHAIQAWACFSLARLLREQAIAAKLLRDPTEEQRLARFVNPDVLKHYKDSDPDKLLKEAENLLERVVSKYGDVKSARGTLGELAKATLFEMHNLVVGRIAPEIEGEDIDGKCFKLSDYRGKVVLLDFWGHW